MHIMLITMTHDLVAQKPAGALPGPGRLGFTSEIGATSDRMAGLLAEMDCFHWAVAFGGLRIPLNLAVPLFFRG